MRTLVPSLLLVAGAVAADPIPAPQAMPTPDAYALVVAPDIKATFGRIEQAVAALMPGALPPGMIAMQAGMVLGDPGLAKLAAKPVVIAVVPGVPFPSVIGLVPSTDPAAYVQAASGMGMVAEAAGELAIIGRLPMDLDAGRKLAKDYAAIAAPAAGVDLRIVADWGKVAATYGPMISGFMQMGMAQAAGQSPEAAVAAKYMPAIFAGVLAAAKDFGPAQTDLALKGVTLHVDQIIAAKPGSGLAKALVEPAPGPVPPVPGNGFMVMAGRTPMAPLLAYAAQLLRTVQQDPLAGKVVDAQMIDLVQRASAVVGSGWAGSATGTTAIEQTGAYALADAGQLRALLQQSAAVLGKPLADAGLTLTYAQAVRTSGSAQVDSWVVAPDPAKPAAGFPPEAMPPMEIAIVQNMVYYSTTPAALDAAIAGGAPAKIAAVATFPGFDAHVDVEIIGYFRAMMAAQAKANPMLGMFQDTLRDVPPALPIQAASRTAGGAVQLKAEVPLAGFFRIATAMQGGGNGKPQQQQSF